MGRARSTWLVDEEPLCERLEDASARRTRGVAAQTLLRAFQSARADRRKLRPLGTWTPEGHVTQP
ncbi:hypothetical protein ACGFZZ_17100 [Streptomyces tendae]|uniref:hypothetical protein n=1 Tax=Streptomyces tendae TaxID=1932 RepID=UPI0033D79EE2